MKTEEFRRLLIEDRYLKNWVNGEYYWNDNGSVDVVGSVFNGNFIGEKIPIKFRKVSGDFHCSYGRLTTLKNSPEEVGGWFSCGDNKLLSLDYAPKKAGFFWCGKNPGKFTQKQVRKICKVENIVYTKEIF